MSLHLLDLRHVPDDEADGIRALLDARGIAWYETPPSRWGVSGGAIWLRDEADAGTAAMLLGQFQHEHRERARAEQAAALREGRAPSFRQGVREQPLRLVLALLALAFALALLALPVWLLRT